jgi:hypothetical protein
MTSSEHRARLPPRDTSEVNTAPAAVDRHVMARRGLNFLRTASPWSWIAVAGIVAHGLVTLSSYSVWDSWMWASDLVKTGQLTILPRLFHETGRPLDMVFYTPLRALGASPVVLAKVLGVAAWIGSAMCMAAVMHHAARMPVAISTAVAVLAVTAPVFDLLGELALWMNTAAVLLFWGAWLAVTHIPSAHGVYAHLLRMSAWGMFFLSFNLNSNLVMFYAVAALIAGMRTVGQGWTDRWRSLMNHSIRYADFCLLPIVFWVWKTVFTPTSGYYATGYNQPSLELTRLASGYAILLGHFVVGGCIDLLTSPSALAMAFFAGIAFFCALRYLDLQAFHVPALRRTGLSLTAWGCFLLVAAAFPYIAVGQPLTNEDWWTRNCILCPLPVALIACGMVITANSLVMPHRPQSWMIGVVALAFLGIGGSTRNYLSYQALGAKQDAAHAILHEVISDSAACAVQLRDRAFIPHTIAYYPPVVWTFIASGTASPPTAFVFDTSMMAADRIETAPDGSVLRLPPVLTLSSEGLEQAIDATTNPYALERIPHEGPQVVVALEYARHDLSPTQLGLRYLLLGLFDRAGRDELMKSVLHASGYKLPAVQHVP